MGRPKDKDRNQTIYLLKGVSMKPVYIKYLIESVHEIFDENFGMETQKGKVSFYTHGLKADVGAVISLTGDLEGDIILMLDESVALEIASRMFQEEIKKLDDLTLSSITELLNFIAGRMITKLSQLKYDNDITPPELFLKKKLYFDENQYLACHIVFKCEVGTLEFALAKKKTDQS
ncbi:MAG: hypothetical protein IEMM0008_0141 [bacterium]|nr:MAG: hypothetical protein IEMM0008_0141 [bacterium]